MNAPLPLDWKRAAIAVSGLNSADNPAPGVPVARSLREAGHTGPLVGLAYDSLDSGIYREGLFDHVYMMPFPSSGAEAVLQRLLRIRDETGLQAVMPALDSEMDLYASLEEVLEREGIRSHLPRADSLELRSKARLASFCEQQRILVPPTRSVYDLAGLEKAWKELADPTGQQPVYIKGQYYEAEKARTIEEARASFRSISRRWGLPIVMQRGLPGHELNICCLGDGMGGLVGAVAMRKLALTAKGKAWAGVTVGEPLLYDFARRVIHALRWRGPCELEVLRHEHTDQLHLIEINPRFPAWCSLCAGAGVNLPAAHASLVLGQDPGDLPAAKSGVIYTRLSIDQVCDLSTLQALNTAGQIHFPPAQPQGDPR